MFTTQVSEWLFYVFLTLFIFLYHLSDHFLVTSWLFALFLFTASCQKACSKVEMDCQLLKHRSWPAVIWRTELKPGNTSSAVCPDKWFLESATNSFFPKHYLAPFDPPENQNCNWGLLQSTEPNSYESSFYSPEFFIFPWKGNLVSLQCKNRVNYSRVGFFLPSQD